MSSSAADAPHVAIVGGGLAGLAAAVALSTAGCRVELFEARSTLGGRAASFRDPSGGELVDHCQHVSMGCCTNLADFCRRTGTADLFRRDRALHFVSPQGRLSRLEAVGWLPAPLHLVPGFLRLTFLSLADKLRIGRAMWKLMREHHPPGEEQTTIGSWLTRQGQTPAAMEHFWSVILVSALGEQLDRASLSAARKVFIDGFLSSREAYCLEVPRVSLGTLYGQRIEQWLADRGVSVRTSTPIERVDWRGRPVVTRAGGMATEADFVVLAVPWNRLRRIVSDELATAWTWLDELTAVEGVPITGVHLWFDRPVMPLAHAVLIGRLSQWVFNRPADASGEKGEGHYYQVVISASRDLSGRDRDSIVCQVRQELEAIWPEAAGAKLLRARVVTDPSAVFSPRPGLEPLRPRPGMAQRGVYLAGDWTKTGWPATMESAVRSGYLAAEGILESLGRRERFLVPELTRGLLARWMIKGQEGNSSTPDR